MSGGGGTTTYTEHPLTDRFGDDQQAKDFRGRSQRDVYSMGQGTQSMAKGFVDDLAKTSPYQDLQNIQETYSPMARDSAQFARGGRQGTSEAGRQSLQYMKGLGKSYDPAITAYGRAANDPRLKQAQNLAARTMAGGYLNSGDAHAKQIMAQAKTTGADQAARAKSRAYGTGTGMSTMNRLATNSAMTNAMARGNEASNAYKANIHAQERQNQMAAMKAMPGLAASQANLRAQATNLEKDRVNSLLQSGSGYSKMMNNQAMGELQAANAAAGLETNTAMAPWLQKVQQAQASMGMNLQGYNPYQVLTQTLGMSDQVRPELTGEKQPGMIDYLAIAGEAMPDSISISDCRLKKDIQQIGTYNGMNVYTFTYLWSDDTQVGVMAQEVMQTNPDAVVTHPDGYLMVDYAKII